MLILGLEKVLGLHPSSTRCGKQQTAFAYYTQGPGFNPRAKKRLEEEEKRARDLAQLIQYLSSMHEPWGQSPKPHKLSAVPYNNKASTWWVELKNWELKVPLKGQSVLSKSLSRNIYVLNKHSCVIYNTFKIYYVSTKNKWFSRGCPMPLCFLPTFCPQFLINLYSTVKNKPSHAFYYLFACSFQIGSQYVALAGLKLYVDLQKVDGCPQIQRSSCLCFPKTEHILKKKKKPL